VPVAWLWPGRLALGKLALLEGDPGRGKSLVSLDLCARLSTGRPMPDGSASPGLANSVILAAEDNAGDTIRPRLAALEADLNRVFILEDEDAEFDVPLRLPSRIKELDAVLTDTDARLFVIDPIKSFLPPKITDASDIAVRGVLVPLVQLAAKHRCTILLVRHLNKRGGFSRYRGSGTIAYLAVCRSAWLLALDPKEPARCCMAQVKNNLARPQPTLSFAVREPAEGSVSVSWLGTSPCTADLLLAASPGAPAPSALERACAFLEHLLQDGPMTVHDIWQAAEAQNLAERTIQRAREKLKVRSIRVVVDGRHLIYWAGPGQELPASVPREAIPPSLEEYLAPLREKYPDATPLDDL
jgi:hypothetical protein